MRKTKPIYRGRDPGNRLGRAECLPCSAKQSQLGRLLQREVLCRKWVMLDCATLRNKANLGAGVRGLRSERWISDSVKQSQLSCGGHCPRCGSKAASVEQSQFGETGSGERRRSPCGAAVAMPAHKADVPAQSRTSCRDAEPMKNRSQYRVRDWARSCRRCRGSRPDGRWNARRSFATMRSDRSRLARRWSGSSLCRRCCRTRRPRT